MSAEGRWFIAPHAVERYIERHRPELAYDRALGELILWSEVATQTCRMRTGDYEFRSEFPAKIRFVVSYRSEGELPVLVTVLPRKKQPTWVNVAVDVALAFDGLTTTDDRSDRIEGAMREWLAVRRVKYAMEKRENSWAYKKILAAAAKSSARIAADPVRKDLRIAAERHVHTERRAAEVASRPPCPECGGPISLVARMGRVRKFCSATCKSRVARRSYWQRKHGKGTRAAGERGGRHWTPRELDELRATLNSLSEKFKRSPHAIGQQLTKMAQSTADTLRRKSA